MTLSCEVFAQTVHQLGLIEADEATSISLEIPPEKRGDAQPAAKLLIERGKITKFQAVAIYQGKAAALTYGDYLIVDRIGAGGMGQVFKARHRRMDRLVALKVMSQSSMNNADAVKRFEREVRAAAKLAHPNIVTAYDAGAQDGVHYLVMELVDGPDLSSLLKSQGKLPVKKVANFISQAARGLAFAHGKGVVHRDIKPGNLLVDSAGTVKILDLGLARIDGLGDGQEKREAELTRTGAIMGTVDYMAPEHALHTRHADARSDVYSLGCTLYRLLTGELPYVGESTVEKILAHRSQPIPSLRQRCPEVPPALDAFYQRMLAKQPEARPSMQEVSETLGSLDLGAAGSSGIGLATSVLPPGGAANAGLSGVGLSSVGLSGIGLPGAAVPTAMPPTAMSAPGYGSTFPGAASESLSQGYAVAPPPMPPPLPSGPSLAPPSTIGRLPAKAMPQAKGAAPPKKRSNTPLLAAAGAGAVLLALGVWFIFRDKDGNETARVQMPEGGTVEAVTVAEPPPAVPPNAAAPPSAVDPKKFFTPPVAPKPTPVATIDPATLPALAVAPFDAAHAQAFQKVAAAKLGLPVESTNAVGMTMVVLPAGRCPIGSTTEDIEKYIDHLLAYPRETSAPPNADKVRLDLPPHESPQHWIEIPSPFLIGKHEVTVGQFKKFVAATNYLTSGERKGNKSTWRSPEYAAPDDSPITYVDYADMTAFCDWLTQEAAKQPPVGKSPLRYKLPLEAQWEYACRAGTTTLAYFGDDLLGDVEEYAWTYSRDRDNDPMPVGRKKPNAFGLYDMLGNVYEVSRDNGRDYSHGPKFTPKPETAGVNRGSAIAGAPFYAYSARRYLNSLAGSGKYGGFRVVAIPADVQQEYIVLPLDGSPVATVTPPPAPPQTSPSTASPTVAATGGPDLWIYPDVNPDRLPRVQIKSLHYDGKTPLTIEAWAVTPMPPNGQLWADVYKPISHLPYVFRFHNPPQLGSQAYVYWARSDQDPNQRSFSLQHTLQGAPGASLKTRSDTFAPMKVGTEPHHLVLMYEPLPNNLWRVTRWFDGKFRDEKELSLQFDPAAFLESDAFISELRVSKVARYQGDFVPQKRFEPDADTVALYHCDEGSGTKLIDSSGNNHHGDLGKIGWARVDAVAAAPVAAVTPPQPVAPPTQPVAAPVAGDLWIYPDPIVRETACITVESLHYDGSTPLTIEAVCMPYPTAAVVPTTQSGRVGFTMFGFERTVTSFSQFGLRWELYPDDPARDSWNNSTVKMIGGTRSTSSGSAGKCIRNAPNHVALTMSAKSGNFQLLTVWVNGKRSRTQNFEFVYNPSLPLVSHGFLSELRVSKVVRYTSDFTPQSRFNPDADTIALYHCDEGSGTRLIDSSGNNHHGILANAKWAPFGSPPSGQVVATAPTTMLGLPVVSPAPVPPPPVVRKPIPDSKAQQAALALIKDIYRDDYAQFVKQPDSKSTLALKLYQEASRSTEPAQTYALLDEARRLDVDAGDAYGLRQVLDLLTREFDVDATATHVDNWEELLRKPRPDAMVQALHDEAFAYFKPATETGRLDDAKRYLDFTLSAARKLKNAKLIKEATERVAALTARRQDADAAKAALKKLKETPDDPAANFTIGRYLGVIENDWPRAMPLLAKGNDETFKKAAEKAIPPPTDAAGFSAAGDAWWDAAQTAKVTQKPELLAAAAFWYMQAQTKLTGLQKARVEKRIEDAAEIVQTPKIPATRLATLTAGTDLDGVLPPPSAGASAVPFVPTPVTPPSVALVSLPPSTPVTGTGIDAIPQPNHPSDPVRSHPPLPASVMNYVSQGIRDKRTTDAVTQRQGQGSGDGTYRDVTNGGILIGFDISYSYVTFTKTGRTAYINSLRPIYLEGSRTTAGKPYGTFSAPTTHLEAKTGYAVGKIHITRSLYVFGLLVTYMRITPTGLDPNDSYDSPHYGGGPGGSALGTIGGDGSLIVGVYGTGEVSGQSLHTIGLVTLPPMPK